ncbi:hypothetical protein KKF91_14125 [Myxococcota bacterium]|nr:hypothetical protein [Myxococcota bacterium]MBU1431677.1 hypothetical protein [Myxococcota bacterium]MBU1900022.1 hypothetical protein [Myxococcota bacterium]
MAQGNFKRINFFRGFLTTEEDLNSSERYHVEKRKLHNAHLHAPGVVPNRGDELKVTSRGRGDLSIEIGSGYAIDGMGHDILLLEKQIKTFNLGDFKLPATIYIVLRYVEEFTDFIAYKENLDYQGHRRIEEGCKIDFTIVEPNIDEEIEIGRVYLEQNARRVTDAQNPNAPGPNELDLRFVPKAGVAGGRLNPLLIWRIAEMIARQKAILAHLARVKKILAAQDAFHAVITLDMMMKTQLVNSSNVWGLLRVIAALEWDLVDEVETRIPDLSSRKEFMAFKKNVDILRGLVDERRRTDEGLDNVITYQNKASEAIDLLMERIRPDVIDVKFMPNAPKPSELAGPLLEGGIAYEDIKVRSEDFTETLIVDGREWRMIDRIDLLNKENEEEHSFAIKDAEDTWRTRQKLRYPDGVVIEDVGIAHQGGFAQFKVKNLTPHQDLVMIRRMDYVRADYQAEIHVDNARLERLLVCDGEDRKFRWRNWPYVIPAQYINKESVTIKQIMLTADRDINMFTIWFYQPK